MSTTGLYCQHCGQLNPADTAYCGKCGARQQPYAFPSQQGNSAPSQTAPSGPALVSSDTASSVPPRGDVNPPTRYYAEPAAQGPKTAFTTEATSGTVYADSQEAASDAMLYRSYGGFWIRVLATLIDGIIIMVATWPFRAALVNMVRSNVSLDGASAIGFVLVGMLISAAFGVFVNWIYSAGMESSKYQATLGKLALGLKVTDIYGNRISFGRATGRCFAKYLSSFILCIGYLMVAFTQYKQGLHDMIAGTLVERS